MLNHLYVSMKKLLLVFILQLNIICVFSQITISGKITDKQTHKPLSGVSIYINNSSIGSSSNAKGEFSLVVPQKGSYDVVFSSIGYSVLMKNVTLEQNTTMQIQLEPKKIEIEEVVLIPYIKDGWAQWGKVFMENFIGMSEFASKTTLKNHKALKFRYNKRESILTVSADEPLEITNNALGYTIVYDLQAFSLDFKSNSLYFEGFVFFKPFKKETKKFLKNRELAYNSSSMKFIRSTYHSSWGKEGYTVRRLVKQPNVQRAYAEQALKPHTLYMIKSFGGSWDNYFKTLPIAMVDTINTYRNLMQQPKIISVLGAQITERDVLSQKNGARYLSFSDYLYIQNATIQYEDGYFASYQQSPEASMLGIIVDSPIEIDLYGNYYPASGLILENYWSWYCKLGTLLPLDYGINNKP